MEMKFIEWLEATSSEVLEKLAEVEQDRLVAKVIDQLIPLMEKQAEYTLYLIKQAAEEAPPQETTPPQQEEKVPEEEEVQGLPAKPASGSKDNLEVDPVTKSQPGLQVNEIRGAVEEALQAGQPDKIMSFVKAVASHYPENVEDVIKIVKVELQDAGMKQLITVEDAAKIADELNALAEGGQKGQVAE